MTRVNPSAENCANVDPLSTRQDAAPPLSYVTEVEASKGGTIRVTRFKAS